MIKKAPPRRVLAKRSFSLAGHRTSVALEEAFWTALSAMAERQGRSLSALVAAVDGERDPERPLASSLRTLALLDAVGMGHEEK